MATNKVTTNVIDMSGNTGGLVWAKGTEAQRPTGVAGDLRLNTTDNRLEYKDNVNWKRFSENTSAAPPGTQNAEVFMVGGGGGGGAQNNTSGDYPGGGAGGYTTTTATIALYGNVTVNVGAGGAAGVYDSSPAGGTGGTTSIINSGTTYSIAGGTGGLQSYDGGNGGSGGGTATDGAGGTDGGNGGASDGTTKGVGQGTTTREFADAGRTLYAGGGGSGRWTVATPGGAGGGGAGQSDKYNLGGGANGTTNLGGGGGGRSTFPNTTPPLPAYAGGSGIVVVRVNKSSITANIGGYSSTNSDATYNYYVFNNSTTMTVTL
jgi:hypothetical protein